MKLGSSATDVASMAPRSAAAGPSSLDLAMRRYADGHEAAFVELYTALAPRVQRFLLRLAGSTAIAADLTQETFLRVHRARGTFDPRLAVVPWVLTIARNACADHLRRSPRTPAAPNRLEQAEGSAAFDVVPGRSPASPEDTLVAKETRDRVAASLDAMPHGHREAFVLIRLEGLSTAEAAQVIGITETAAKLRLFRAYEAIRGTLARSEGAPR